MESFENVPFDDIEEGMSVEVVRRLSAHDIQCFAALSGDVNPFHVDRDFARDQGFEEIIAHGIWGASLISAAIGTRLPGPGTILVSQKLDFLQPIEADDRIRTIVRVARKEAEGRRLTLDCRCERDDGEVVLKSTAEVIAPEQKLRHRRSKGVGGNRFDRLIAETREAIGEPVRCAVVNPIDEASLRGAVQAAEAGLIEPVLIGAEEAVRSAAESAELEIERFALIEVRDAAAAAARASELAAEDEVQMLMKGRLQTTVLMTALLQKKALRTGRIASHVFVMDVPRAERLLLITDAAINIAPDLDELRDIVQNAIDLAVTLGIEQPHVALLSATEAVRKGIASTCDAAAICKMADRGQITGGVIDGPLAFDNAISERAAAIKGIISPVAGRADILVVPELVAGNMLAKQLDYLAGGKAAGVVVGLKTPVSLTSRADSPAERVASAAIAARLAAGP